MKTVTIKYGLTNRATLEFEDDATVEDIVNDARVQSALGFGENVRVRIEGEEVSMDHEPSDGDLLTVEKTACRKG